MSRQPPHTTALNASPPPPAVRPRERLAVHTGHDAHTYVIGLEGPVDISTLSELRRAVAAAERSLRPQIVVDLGSARLIDNAALRVLLDLDERLTAAGRGLLLLPGPPLVQLAFERSGLDRVLTFAHAPGGG